MKGIMKYEDFIRLVDMAKGTDGCAYMEVGAGLYLVMAWLESIDGEGYTQEYNDKMYTLMGKIAYNCDDLQCDYDYDWCMPTDKDGNVFDTENYVYATEENYKEWKELIEDTTDGVRSGTLKCA